MTAQQRITMRATQDIGGAAGCSVFTTPVSDTVRINLIAPPDGVIPIVFVPGMMGTNLRMSRRRQAELEHDSNIAWRPDFLGDTLALRNADAATRQLNFDPNETEVDRYHITTDGDKFDMTGRETEDADRRHRNVPDGLPDIGLLTSDPVPPPSDAWKSRPHREAASAAQRARWRGWSEVHYGSYGQLLQTLEARLNGMLAIDRYEVDPMWQEAAEPVRDSQGEPVGGAVTGAPDGLAPVGKAPHMWGADCFAPPLRADDILRIGDCWYPVHAMGYNWLECCGVSAQRLARRIEDLIAMYQQHGRRCTKVIIVTHSMGGLVTRALLHPHYGNLHDKVLGVVHNVMPTHGAPAAYKRMRCGFEGMWPVKQVLGATGKHVTPILANAPGLVQLLPAGAHALGWLRVEDEHGRELMRWPSAQGNALEEIYLQPPQAWWRLINPKWINPAGLKPLDRRMSSYEAVLKRLGAAYVFHQYIHETFHPETYASYGNDRYQATFGCVVWRISKGEADGSHPGTWRLLDEDGEGRVTVITPKGTTLTLAVRDPEAPGDGTVPATVAKQVWAKHHFVQQGYEHQLSYQNEAVLASTLYAIARIAQTSDLWKDKCPS